MKIFSIGANLESYKALHFLVKNKCKIDTLITLPRGSGEHVSDYYDLHDFCEKNNIKVIDTLNVNCPNTIELIAHAKPDYLFTLGWSQIFKEDLINSFSKFIIGTHPTKLPYGRGRAPIPWTIIEGLEESAVSFFKIDKGIDTGQLIFQKHFKIKQNIYAKELYDVVAEQLGIGFVDIYNAIINKKEILSTKQTSDNVSVRGKRTIADGLIQFTNGILYNHKLIRAVSEPYPGVYCYYKDKKIIFWEVENDSVNTHNGVLGQILKKTEEGILVQFLDGNLWLNNITFNDKKPVPISFFKVGDTLGYNIQDEIYNLKKLIK